MIKEYSISLRKLKKWGAYYPILGLILVTMSVLLLPSISGTCYSVEHPSSRYMCRSGTYQRSESLGPDVSTSHYQFHYTPELMTLTSWTIVMFRIEVNSVSIIDSVILSYSEGGREWKNLTFIFHKSENVWEEGMDTFEPLSEVFYRAYANDTNGFWGISEVHSFSVSLGINEKPILILTGISVVVVMIFLPKKRNWKEKGVWE